MLPSIGYQRECPKSKRSVGRLEEERGQPLFERQTRSVSLTDAGHLLLERARQILLLVDDTKARFNDDGQTGRIRVASIPTIAPYFLPDCLSPPKKIHWPRKNRYDCTISSHFRLCCSAKRIV
ncbi:MAG: LysR family transcriptional regulator [Pirellula sp.]|nr:LysR family transcriptional regulator [Pirellula sp.]